MNAQAWKCAAKVNYARRKLAERGEEHYGSCTTAYIVQLIQLQRENASLRARESRIVREADRQLKLLQTVIGTVQQERDDTRAQAAELMATMENIKSYSSTLVLADDIVDEIAMSYAAGYNDAIAQITKWEIDVALARARGAAKEEQCGELMCW